MTKLKPAVPLLGGYLKEPEVQAWTDRQIDRHTHTHLHCRLGALERLRSNRNKEVCREMGLTLMRPWLLSGREAAQSKLLWDLSEEPAFYWFAGES